MIKGTVRRNGRGNDTLQQINFRKNAFSNILTEDRNLLCLNPRQVVPNVVLTWPYKDQGSYSCQQFLASETWCLKALRKDTDNHWKDHNLIKGFIPKLFPMLSISWKAKNNYQILVHILKHSEKPKLILNLSLKLKNLCIKILRQRKISKERTRKNNFCYHPER